MMGRAMCLKRMKVLNVVGRDCVYVCIMIYFFLIPRTRRPSGAHLDTGVGSWVGCTGEGMGRSHLNAN